MGERRSRKGEREKGGEGSRMRDRERERDRVGKGEVVSAKDETGCIMYYSNVQSSLEQSTMDKPALQLTKHVSFSTSV